MMMKREMLMFGLKHGKNAAPGLFAFIRKWWWAIALAIFTFIGLGLWAAIALALWLWEAAPQVVAYVLNHFAPAVAPVLEQYRAPAGGAN
jgi:uncharacterized membrane protein YpjA